MAWIPQNGIAVHVDDKETNRGYKGWFSYAKGYPELNVVPIRGGNVAWDALGWGYIAIDACVFDEAVKRHILHEKVKGYGKRSRISNKYYRTNADYGNGDMFNQHKVKPRYMTIVTHEYVNNNKNVYACSIMDWDYQVINVLKSNSFYLMNTRKNGKFHPGRHVILVNTGKKKVQMAMILNLINQLRKGIQIGVEGLEPHHKYALHDQRTKSIMNCTPEQHKSIHKIMGSEGHRFDIHIRTVRELEIYLDFLETDLYKQMFVRDGKKQSV